MSLRCAGCKATVDGAGLVAEGVAWHHDCRLTAEQGVHRITLTVDTRTQDIFRRVGGGNLSLGARRVCKSLPQTEIDRLAAEGEKITAGG